MNNFVLMPDFVLMVKAYTLNSTVNIYNVCNICCRYGLDEVEASFVKKQDSPKKLSKTLSSSNKIKEYVMSILFWIYKF